MDFTAVDLRVGTVSHATAEGDALRLTVDVGGDLHEVLAHIAENYGPADVIDTQVAVVMSGPSAVVLAAVNASEGAVLLRPDRPVASGTRVV